MTERERLHGCVSHSSFRFSMTALLKRMCLTQFCFSMGGSFSCFTLRKKLERCVLLCGFLRSIHFVSFLRVSFSSFISFARTYWGCLDSVYQSTFRGPVLTLALRFFLPLFDRYCLLHPCVFGFPCRRFSSCCEWFLSEFVRIKDPLQLVSVSSFFSPLVLLGLSASSALRSCLTFSRLLSGALRQFYPCLCVAFLQTMTHFFSLCSFTGL